MLRIATAAVVLALGVGVGTSQAAELDAELVRDAIAKEARRSLPDTVVEVEVHGLFVRGSVDVPSGVDPEVRIRADGDEDWVGKVAVEVTVTVNGQLLREVRATAEVAAYVQVPVLRFAVARGERIEAADVAMTRRDAASLPGGIITDASALVGRTPRRDLSLNNLLREADLAERLDARRNRPVTLLIQSGALRITAAGVLQRDARVGDLVEVLTLETDTVVHGILVAPGVVEVPTSGQVGRTAQR